MKKLFIVLSMLLLSFQNKSVREFKFSEGQATMLYSTLEFVKAYLPTSEAKGTEITQVLRNIDSIEKIIIKQYKDSTKK